MAVITSTFQQTSFPLNSGKLVIKIKVAAIVPSIFLAFSPVQAGLIFQRINTSGATKTKLPDSNFISSFYDKYWRQKSHIITGNSAVGFSENPIFSLGNILTQQTRQFRLYNAREVDDIQILTVILNNAEGITIDDPVQPDEVNNKSSKIYTLIISPEGPPIINATVTIITSEGETFVVTFVGSRTIVVPFIPQLPIRESLAYKTWIQSHKDGTEQRQGFRDIGIQSIIYNYLNTERLSSMVENFFYLRADTVFGIPYFPGETFLTTDAAITSLTFTVDNAADKGFREGTGESLALILRDEFTFEAVQVTDITGNVFTLQQELLNNWVIGDFVLPLRRGFLRSPEQVANLLTVRNFLAEYDMVANLEEPSDSGFTQFQSLPVFEQLLLINGSTFPRTFDAKLQVFNPETAPSIQKSFVRSPALTTGFIREFDSLTDFFTFYKFFQFVQGRREPFWIRTGLTDFQIESDLAAGVIIRVVNVLAALVFDSNTSNRRKNLAIEYVDGTIDYLTISNIVEVSNTREDITLTSTSSQALSSANVHRISYLEKVRFATDQLDFLHDRGTVISVAVSITDLDE